VKVVAPIALATMACLSAGQPPVPAFNSARAFDELRQIVAIGPRPAGSPGAQQTRDYVKRQLSAAGLAVVEQSFEAQTPLGTTRMVNLRVQLPGGDASGRRLIIAGHYDTKLFKDETFVGANDGGSSTAFLIELARVLKARRNALPVEILFLDGEEAAVDWHHGDDHTYGSRHYVAEARKEGTLKEIAAMILVDMIGDRDLNIRKEALSTTWLTEIVWETARRLGHGRHFLAEGMPVEDDHAPFLRAGVPAVLLIDFDYPPWHTAQDTLDKVSARSLAIVGEVVREALPAVEQALKTIDGHGPSRSKTIDGHGPSRSKTIDGHGPSRSK
jgi:glutaminyl-peptide cyclotransferase